MNAVLDGVVLLGEEDPASRLEADLFSFDICGERSPHRCWSRTSPSYGASSQFFPDSTLASPMKADSLFG